MTDLAGFLGRYPPFAGAEPDELERLAEGSQQLHFAPGCSVLVEDGAVSSGLYVVRRGAVELVHDGEAVDVLDVGQAFGHPSMLTGRAPAFTVRTRVDSDLILVPAQLAVPHLSSEFVAATLRARMVRTGQVVHAQGDVRTAHLGDLVHRPAAICRPDDSVREAARRMAEKDVSCILVEMDGGWGVLTDSDLRRKLVAEGLPYDTPARISATIVCGRCWAAAITCWEVSALLIARRTANGVRLSRYIRSVAVTMPSGVPRLSTTGRWWMPRSSMSIIASMASRSGGTVIAWPTISAETGVS